MLQRPRRGLQLKQGAMSDSRLSHNQTTCMYLMSLAGPPSPINASATCLHMRCELEKLQQLA